MTVVVVFALIMVVGEWLRVVAPGVRDSAPLFTAAAFALALSTQMPAGSPVPLSPWGVIAVAAGAQVVGVLTRPWGRGNVGLLALVGRLVAVAVLVLIHSLLVRNGLDPATGTPEQPVLLANVMVWACGLALITDVVFTSLPALERGTRAFLRRFADEQRAALAIHLGLAFTGPLIALAARPLGVAALPVFLVPMLLTQIAYRRYVAVRTTYRQGIATLSRITDLTGHTPSGHAERVAQLSVDMGRRLAMSERALLDLEYAGLLHDLGQVALAEPIPLGATVLAAPVDQRRIQSDTVHIVRAAGVLDTVAHILSHQATPFRNVRELSEDVPLASRVLKVANAFVDLAQNEDLDAADSALERIHLGLGYEYDPEVVAALERVIRSRRVAAAPRGH